MLEEVESLAVDYFELNGFLVRRGLGASVGSPEAVYPSLIVRNLKEEVIEDHLLLSFQWFSSDIIHTGKAVVAIIGEELFSLGNRAIRQDKRMLKILKKQVFSKQSLLFPWEVDAAQGDLHGHRKLVLLPLLPSIEPDRSEFCDQLSKKGVDGVITLRTLLDNMIQQLDNLDESRLTQRLKMLRILKQMELMKIPQLDLFASLKS
jgi:hypothetical protein